jgi:hypothetical protein
MPLTDRDKHLLDIISQYTFLNHCREKGIISEEKQREIIFRFGAENQEVVNYYANQLDAHHKDSSMFLNNLKKP